MNQLTLFKIRDLRQKDQYKIDDLYISGGYARICGKFATCVYNSLCRHAEFNTQKAFPSQGKIAYDHNIPIKQVRQGFKMLMQYNIIMAETNRSKGKFDNYTYFLIDKSQWKNITIGQNRPTANHRSITVGGKRPTKDNKEQRITKSILTVGQADGGKNDIEKLVRYYFEVKGLMGSTARPTQYFRAAGQLLTICDNDLKQAMEKIDRAKTWARIKNIEWGIDTIIKRFLEI